MDDITPELQRLRVALVTAIGDAGFQLRKYKRHFRRADGSFEIGIIVKEQPEVTE